MSFTRADLIPLERCLKELTGVVRDLSGAIAAGPGAHLGPPCPECHGRRTRPQQAGETTKVQPPPDQVALVCLACGIRFVVFRPAGPAPSQADPEAELAHLRRALADAVEVRNQRWEMAKQAEAKLARVEEERDRLREGLLSIAKGEYAGASFVATQILIAERNRSTAKESTTADPAQAGGSGADAPGPDASGGARG